ncbi:hypothetical protein ACI6PS_02610 [Flavobacterium sp. PLA-1-15]|uniref:hypothetical protein n=1 Tax=Flavobacterium sp. PLA-1-15 TaxID=3380533 RepID=UPI003B7C7872
MNLRQNRNETARAVLEGRFIRSVLERESAELNKRIDQTISAGGYSSDFWKDKSMTIIGSGNNLEYRHKKQHRFADMRTRNTKEGKIRKKSSMTHNRKVYGSLNNLVRELSFGFTETVIEDMKSLEIDNNS